MRTKVELMHTFSQRFLLSVLMLLFFVAPVSAQSDSPLMAKGKSLYAQSKYDAALATFQKALRGLRGKPLYQKVPAYLHIGLCLYQKGNQGLAWKAFEQALFQDSSAALPSSASAEIQAFFARVRKRVLARGGNALSRSRVATATPSGNSSGPVGPLVAPSPWPWVALGVGAACATAGLVLVLNASANQTQVDEWAKKAVADGLQDTLISASAQPMRDSIALHNTAGLIILAVGGVAIVGGIVLFFVLPKSAPATAMAPAKRNSSPSNAPLPKRAMVLGQF